LLGLLGLNLLGSIRALKERKRKEGRERVKYIKGNPLRWILGLLSMNTPKRVYLGGFCNKLFLYLDFYTITKARFSSTWGGMCPNECHIRSTKEKEAEQVVVRFVKCKG
jgi:hypothetical protein